MKRIAPVALLLVLGACSPDDAGNATTIDADNTGVAAFEPAEAAPVAQSPSAPPSAPALNLSSGPDVCFRAIAEAFGPDINVAEITSFFSAGEAIAGQSSPPRGQMTSCSVNFQNPADPRKLLSASFDTRTGAFGEARPVEISVMGGNAANFRLSDHVVPLSRVDAAALTGVMSAQDKRLKAVYGDHAWTGVRLSGPDPFNRRHTLRLDLDGRLAANDIKAGGYASVSLDGKRITADYLLP